VKKKHVVVKARASGDAAKKGKRLSIGERALISANQALAHARGEEVPGLIVHTPIDVKAVREQTGLSQSQFATVYGLSAATLRDWEQQRKRPERLAELYLSMIKVAPDVVKGLVQKAHEQAT
jgi:putative transcriptional regulator